MQTHRKISHIFAKNVTGHRVLRRTNFEIAAALWSQYRLNAPYFRPRFYAYLSENSVTLIMPLLRMRGQWHYSSLVLSLRHQPAAVPSVLPVLFRCHEASNNVRHNNNARFAWVSAYCARSQPYWFQRPYVASRPATGPAAARPMAERFVLRSSLPLTRAVSLRICFQVNHSLTICSFSVTFLCLLPFIPTRSASVAEHTVYKVFWGTLHCNGKKIQSHFCTVGRSGIKYVTFLESTCSAPEHTPMLEG